MVLEYEEHDYEGYDYHDYDNNLPPLLATLALLAMSFLNSSKSRLSRARRFWNQVITWTWKDFNNRQSNCFSCKNCNKDDNGDDEDLVVWKTESLSDLIPVCGG